MRVGAQVLVETEELELDLPQYLLHEEQLLLLRHHQDKQRKRKENMGFLQQLFLNILWFLILQLKICLREYVTQCIYGQIQLR